MNRVVRDEIRAENRHHANMIDERSLERHHLLLNSFNMQATLVVGFALSSINADNLSALSDDQSKFCMYKDGRRGWAYLFAISVISCICISLTCIAASFLVTLRTQEYALHVGVRPAVAMVRMYATRVCKRNAHRRPAHRPLHHRLNGLVDPRHTVAGTRSISSGSTSPACCASSSRRSPRYGSSWEAPTG